MQLWFGIICTPVQIGRCSVVTLWPSRGHVRINTHKFRVHWNTTKYKSKRRNFKRRVFSSAATLPILSLFLLFLHVELFFIKPQYFVLRSGSDWGVWVSCIPSWLRMLALCVGTRRVEVQQDEAVYEEDHVETSLCVQTPTPLKTSQYDGKQQEESGRVEE